MSPYGCPCSKNDGVLCDDCVAEHMTWHRGIAYNRGETWARAIAEVIPIERPWPMTEKMRAIARRKVAELASDERLLQLLTDETVRGAAHWWDRELLRRRTKSS